MIKSHKIDGVKAVSKHLKNLMFPKPKVTIYSSFD